MEIEMSHYGKNENTPAHSFTLGNVTFYFSYETLVGIGDEEETCCIENLWSNTTGKHLNEIQPDHKKRLGQEEFNRKVDEILIRNGMMDKELEKNI